MLLKILVSQQEQQHEKLSKAVKESLQDSVNSFQYYSVLADEGKDVKDTAQLAIFAQGINSEFINRGTSQISNTQRQYNWKRYPGWFS